MNMNKILRIADTGAGGGAAKTQTAMAPTMDERIRRKIAESGGALNYDSAKFVIEQQEAAAKQQKPKTKN